MKNLRQDSRSLGCDLNPLPPKYEPGMQLTRHAVFPYRNATYEAHIETENVHM
jgi:hypothetical protein